MDNSSNHELEAWYISHWLELQQDEVYPQTIDAKRLFEKATTWLTSIKANSKPSHRGVVNRIEHAGLERNATQWFCHRVFDLTTSENWVYKDHAESVKQDALNEVLRLQPSLGDAPQNVLLRARNEVIQHAKTYQHELECFVFREEDLSEELIKETHRVLTMDVPLEDERDDAPAGTFIDEAYGGFYRNVIVTAGTTCFAHPKGIPGLMTAVCQDLKIDIENAKETTKMDPFSLAAKYSMKFVQIHPFRDGNGRMCRIILNAILCRFVEVCCSIGEDDEDIKTYIGIKRKEGETLEGETLEGHGEYAYFVLKKCHTRIREMKKRLNGRNGEKKSGDT